VGRDVRARAWARGVGCAGWVVGWLTESLGPGDGPIQMLFVT
jgi:hypothetical protein